MGATVSILAVYMLCVLRLPLSQSPDTNQLFEEVGGLGVVGGCL